MFGKGKLAWLILALVHILVAAVGFVMNSNQTADSAEYLHQATNLREHLSFYCGEWSAAFIPERFSLRPPGYGVFLSLTSWGSANLLLPVFLQIVISLATIYIAWKCVRIISGKQVNSWLFLIPLTGFLTQFIYSGMIMSEILFQFFLISAIACAIMFHHSGMFKWVIGFQVALAVAMLIKPVMWLFPLVSFPMIVWLYSGSGFSKKLYLSFLIPFIIIGGMHFRNYSLTGVAEYSSVSRKLMINYNIPALLEQRVSREEAAFIIDSLQNSVSGLTYAERAEEIDTYSRNLIQEAPLDYFLLHIKGMLRFFMDTGRWELRNYFQLQISWQSLGEAGGSAQYLKQWSPSAIVYQIYCVIINLLLLYALIRFAFNKIVDFRNRRILIGVILYLALLTGPSASSRFRLPAFPLQLVAWGVLIAHSSGKLRSTPLNV
jgi:hypothetical protein